MATFRVSSYDDEQRKWPGDAVRSEYVASDASNPLTEQSWPKSLPTGNISQSPPATRYQNLEILSKTSFSKLQNFKILSKTRVLGPNLQFPGNQVPLNFPGSPHGNPAAQQQSQQQHQKNQRNSAPKKNRTPSCYNCGDQGHDAESCRDQGTFDHHFKF